MKITNVYDSLITEGESKKTKYGCVMLYMKPTNELKSLQDKISDEDVYSKIVDGKEDYGRTPDDEFHVTVLYGSESSVTDIDVKKVIYSENTPKITVKNITLFENDKFDVVKIDVESKELDKLNEAMKQYPYTTDYPDYHPHCTIAYVKPGAGKQYVRELNDLELIPSHYIYSKVDGTKTRFELK